MSQQEMPNYPKDVGCGWYQYSHDSSNRNELDVLASDEPGLTERATGVYLPRFFEPSSQLGDIELSPVDQSNPYIPFVIARQAIATSGFKVVVVGNVRTAVSSQEHCDAFELKISELQRLAGQLAVIDLRQPEEVDTTTATRLKRIDSALRSAQSQVFIARIVGRIDDIEAVSPVATPDQAIEKGMEIIATAA